MHLRKGLLGGAVAVVATFAVATPALAYDCFNASKPVDKGNSVVIGADDEPVDPTPGLVNRLERFGEEGLHGIGHLGFDEDGDGAADGSVMIVGQGILPEPARDNCDGRGIDSYEACFGGH